MPTDAVRMLEKDHAEARDLFERIATTEGPEREEAFEKLATDLRVHIAVEEELFFPRIRELMGDAIPQEVNESQEEEAQDTVAELENLEAMGVDDEDFDERFARFRSTVDQHVIDEEEKLFPLVRRQVDADVLQQLGTRMEERHQALKQELQRSPAR